MRSRIVVSLVVGLILVALGAAWTTMASTPARAADGGFSYTSLPDEVGLYLNDIAFVRDTVTLPVGDVRVLLPPGTFPNTLILTENGARVHSYRIAGQTAEVYYSQAVFPFSSASAYLPGGTAYTLTWESTLTGAGTREIKLEFLMTGGYWTPTYDMQILSDQSVQLAFFAEIHSTGLLLDSAKVALLAGRVDLSQQMETISEVTFNQYAAGYARDESGAMGGAGMSVGTVDLQHIYPVGEVTAGPGDTVYLNLADASLGARRLYVWNAAAEEQVSVIYKVMNTTEIPLAEGIVRTYQDGLFMGSDFIETTPVGSEGSVTVGHLPNVRARRTESQEYRSDALNDFYLHTVTLKLENFSEEDFPVMVLDFWLEEAWDFEFSMEAARDPNNLLRWDVTLPAGESLTITYTFRTEY